MVRGALALKIVDVMPLSTAVRTLDELTLRCLHEKVPDQAAMPEIGHQKMK
jgi:hypothetical protein